MSPYRSYSWFAAIVSIILIFKGLVTSISSTDLDIPTLIIANILPIILLYTSVILLKAKNKKNIATAVSVFISIEAALWLVSLIPGLPIIVAVSIIAVNFLISVVALLLVNWYIGKVAGLLITIIVLLAVAVFIDAYSSSVLPSSGMVNSQS